MNKTIIIKSNTNSQAMYCCMGSPPISSDPYLASHVCGNGRGCGHSRVSSLPGFVGAKFTKLRRFSYTPLCFYSDNYLLLSDKERREGSVYLIMKVFVYRHITAGGVVC